MNRARWITLVGSIGEMGKLVTRIDEGCSWMDSVDEGVEHMCMIWGWSRNDDDVEDDGGCDGDGLFSDLPQSGIVDVSR